MKLKTNLIAILLFVSLTCSAQFTYERKISEVTQAGWHRITLPQDIFSKLKADFSDLRIYASGNDSTEIPYLLKISEDELTRTTVALEPFNVSRQGKALYFTVKLNRNEPVNHAMLEFEQQNYDSEVIVEGSTNQQEWFKLHSSRIISIASPVNYSYNHINFPASTYAYLRFTVQNGAALTLSKVSFYQSEIRKGIFTEVPASLASKTINKQSEFYLTFLQPVLLSRLSVEPVANKQFYRSVAIDWLYDSIKSEKGVHYQYQSLYSGVISSFQQDTLQFTPQVVQQVRVTLYNQDNPPVQVNKIIAWTPQVELLSNIQPGTYALKYGNETVYTPNYDLEHFSKDIPDSLPQLELSSELKPQQTEVPEVEAWFKNKIWMWAILGVIVAILGFFTVRMLREK
jgi:Protein of unknown function (DUF3999)